MAEIKEVQLKITSDTKGVEDGVNRTQRAFDELKTAAAGAAIGFGAVGASIAGVVAIAQRGQGFSELSAAFKNLGQTEGDLNKLRSSVQGLVSDTDLMRASNQALLAGLKPEQFQQAAAAADALGDAVGKNTKTALDDLTLALSKGSDRFLVNYGIVVDNQKAYDDFAKKIGTTAGALNELGKSEATREAILKAVAEKTKGVGDETSSVADEYERLTNIVGSSIDKFAAAINSSKTLTEVFRDFARGVDILAEKLLGLGSTTAKAVELQKQITSARASLGAAESGFYPATETSITAQRANLQQLEIQYEHLIKSVRETGNVSRDTTEDLGKLRDKFTDAGKAAEEAGKRGLTDFKGTLDTITSLFDKTYITDGSFFEKAFGATDTTWISEKLEQEFQSSVDFFSDIFTPMLEGQAANFEDIFKDAAKRIAIGFASQMAASLALKLGFDVSSIGSASGLGGALATSLGFGGGGSKGLGELLSGTSTAASGYGLLSGGSASADFIGPMQPGVSTLGATVGIVAAIAGGAALFAQAVAQFEKSNKDYADATKAGAQTYFAGDVTGISQTYFAAMAAFGGSQDPDTLRRRDLRGALQKTGLGDDLTFEGVNGKTSIFDSGYNQDLSNPQNAGAISLANPLATLFSGGDDVGGQQLAAMFADATDNAENYNEVLINTQALMEGLGINADEAKQGLEDLFLDGKISLDEFSSGITNLNILAQDNLVGTGSVSDAIGILDNELASPRVKLKALELGFKEMSEIGIDTTSEIHDYLTSHFSPDVVAVFDKLAAAGIDTFEEIANATPEQIAIIFDAMKDLASHADDAFSDVGDAIERNVKRGVSGAKKELASLADAARRTGRDVEAAGGSGQNPNQRLNGRPA